MRTPLEIMTGIASERQGIFDEKDVKLIRDRKGNLIDARTGEKEYDASNAEREDEEGGEDG